MDNIDTTEIISDHEEFFLKDTTDVGRFILSIGSKGSGKSYLLCSYLRYVIKNKIFDKIHFCCPAFSGEANKTYDFLKDQKHILIYPHYTQQLSKIVDKDRRKFKTLMIVDDASGELLKQIDNTFVQLSTTTRHYEGCTIYVCVHSCKRILSPIIRQQLDHLFVYRIINANLLQDLYDEYFSMMFNNFKEFKKFYLEATKENNSCIHFSLHVKGLDINVKNWGINTKRDNIKLTPTKAPSKPQPKKVNDDKIQHGGVKISSLFFKMRKRK